MVTAYKTEPLETYEWAKELRLRHFDEAMKAHEHGKLLIMGNMNAPKEIIAGIGDFVHLGGEPWGVFITREGGQKLLMECLEEVERRGYTRDMCAYMRASWGSMFLDKSPWGGFPRPDLIVAFNQCDSQAKWHQVEAEYLNVPFYVIDTPFNGGDGTLKIDEPSLQFGVKQLEDLIEWLQHTFKRPYDEGRMMQAITHAYRSRCLWAEICDLQGTIPAPLDYKLILPFVLALERHAYEEETEKLLAALRDELKYRVAQGITPLPDERCRVTHEGLAPWYALYLFTYLREHRVAVVGGSQQYQQTGPVRPTHEDGTPAPENPPNWNGVPKNKEEALRFRATCFMFSQRWSLDPRVRLKMLKAAITAWKANGVIIMYDRGCQMLSSGQLEVKNAIQKEGIPTLRYETNRIDPREWSWSHVADSMDSFLEALGVPKVEK